MNKLYLNITCVIVFIFSMWLIDTAADFVNSQNDLGVIVGIVLFAIALFLLFVVIRSVVSDIINLFKK
jgi:type IV secretory pathway TrbL component